MKTLTSEQYNALEADLKNLYQEKEGQYHLAAVPRSINTGTLEAKRLAEAEAEALKKRYEGIDPDDVRKQREAAAKAEQERALKAGEFEKVLAQTKAEKDAELARVKSEFEAAVKTSNESLEKLLRDEALTKAALAAGVQTEFLEDVLLHGKDAFKVEKGALVPIGHEYKTADGWLKDKLAKKKGWLGVSTGGDTPPKGGSSGAPRGNLQRSKMTHEEKASFQKQHGLAAYNKLPR